MPKQSTTPTATYLERIEKMKRWLNANSAAPWADYDKDAALAFAMTELGYVHKDRARIVIAKAARLLRGEVAAIRAGRPRKTVTLAVAEYEKMKADIEAYMAKADTK